MKYTIKVEGKYLTDGYNTTTHPDFATKYNYEDAVEICYIINKRNKQLDTAVMEQEETL